MVSWSVDMRVSMLSCGALGAPDLNLVVLDYQYHFPCSMSYDVLWLMVKTDLDC